MTHESHTVEIANAIERALSLEGGFEKARSNVNWARQELDRMPDGPRKRSLTPSYERAESKLAHIGRMPESF